MSSMANSISRIYLVGHLQLSHRRALAHVRAWKRGSTWPRRFPSRHTCKVSVDEQEIEHFVAFESEDEDSWDSKYGEDGVLEYGVAIQQGPRDTMEDFVTIVPKARCGFLFAGASLHLSLGCVQFLVQSLKFLLQASWSRVHMRA
jgi:hypothetical protein